MTSFMLKKNQRVDEEEMSFTDENSKTMKDDGVEGEEEIKDHSEEASYVSDVVASDDDGWEFTDCGVVYM